MFTASNNKKLFLFDEDKVKELFLLMDDASCAILARQLVKEHGEKSPLTLVTRVPSERPHRTQGTQTFNESSNDGCLIGSLAPSVITQSKANNQQLVLPVVDTLSPILINSDDDEPPKSIGLNNQSSLIFSSPRSEESDHSSLRDFLNDSVEHNNSCSCITCDPFQKPCSSGLQTPDNPIVDRLKRKYVIESKAQRREQKKKLQAKKLRRSYLESSDSD